MYQSLKTYFIETLKGGGMICPYKEVTIAEEIF